MKKISSIIIVGIFFCVLLLPHVADRLVKIEHSAIDENRNLTPFPTKIKYRNIARQLEEYYNDRIPFRTILLKGCRNLQSKLLAFTPGNVLPGKNDFLFFRPPGWEDPLDQFCGKGRLRGYDLLQNKKFLCEFNSFLVKNNIRFLLVIAPNKVQVYPEYLPERRKYPASEFMPDLQLVRFMKKDNPEIAIMHLRDALLDAKKYYADNLFYRADTHWNRVGGYIGAREIIKHFNAHANLPEPGNFSLTKCSSNEPTDIVNLSLTPVNYAVYQELSPCIPKYDKPLKKISGNHLYSYNADAPDKRRVLIYRDSFTTAMIPYISNYFREVHYIWSHKVSTAQIADIKPDIVILEYVARYLGRKLK